VGRVSGRANWRNRRNGARPVKALWTGDSSSMRNGPVHKAVTVHRLRRHVSVALVTFRVGRQALSAVRP